MGPTPAQVWPDVHTCSFLNAHESRPTDVPEKNTNHWIDFGIRPSTLSGSQLAIFLASQLCLSM